MHSLFSLWYMDMSVFKEKCCHHFWEIQSFTCADQSQTCLYSKHEGYSHYVPGCFLAGSYCSGLIRALTNQANVGAVSEESTAEKISLIVQLSQSVLYKRNRRRKVKDL